MKQSMMNSGSDTSDDEWIRCADDVPLEDTHGNRLHNEVYSQVTVPLFSSPNDTNNSYITDQQHFNDLYMDENKQIKDDMKEKLMKYKRPTTFLSVLKKVTDDDDMMINVVNRIDDRNKDEFLSYQEKNQYSVLVDPLPRRSYSLDILDQIPETLVDLEKERYFFITKMIANTNDEHHYADIRNLSDFNYSNINGKSDIEYRSSESIENNVDDNDNGDDDPDDDIFVDRILPVKRSKLPSFYEFTFDVKNSIRNDTTKLPSCIDENATLYPFLEKYKPG